MSQDQNSTGATAFSARSSATNGPPPLSGGGPGTDGFLSSLAELENRISSLKAMHEQATSRDIEYSDRERKLAEREAALTNTESSLSEREAAIAARDASLSEREATLAAKDSSVAELEQSAAQAIERVDRLRLELDERSRAVAARADELNSRDAVTAQREAGVAVKEAAFVEREQSVQAQMQAAQNQLDDAGKARGEVDLLSRQVAEREAVMADENAAMMRREDSIEMKMEGAERIREQIMSRGAEIAAREAKITREVAELNSRSAQFERQSANRQAEIDRAETDLTDRERSLSAKAVKAEAELNRISREQEEIDNSRAELEASRAALVSVREEVERARTEIERRDKDITERTCALAENRETLENEQKEAAERIRADEEALAHREDQVHEHEIDLATQRDELDRERAGVTEQARTLAAQLKAQDDDQTAAIWNNRVEQMQIELGQANSDRARLETEVAQLRQSVESVTQELITANQNRGVPEAEVQVRERRITELTTTLEESRAIADTLQERIDTLDKSIKEAEESRARETEGREDEIRAHTERLAAHSRQLDEAIRRAELADAEKSDMVPRTEHDKLEKELTAARELLDQAEADVLSRVPVEEVVRRDKTISKLEKAVEEAEQAAGDLARQEIEAKEAVISDLRKRLEEAATESAGSSNSIAREFERVNEEAQALRDSLRTAEKSLADAAGQTNQDEIDERDRLIAELREQLDAAAQADVESTRDDAESNAETVELQARLDEALAENETLRANQTIVAEPTDQGPGGPTPAELLRRDRLRRYKSLLQTQARKIVSAQAALQRRHADCEIVLTNRGRLAELAQQLARAEKKVTSNKARSGAASTMLYMVATVAILAGLSWEVSKRIWPGTYIARSVIEADAGRRTPSADDINQWQKDHKDLLTDPRLMEMAAERMQRRGLAQTADPAGLAARLKEDLYVQSSRPGSLTVELRGEGAERTALFLDTLTTSFKAFADQSRDERVNDIGVTIAQAATPGAEPLMDKRLERAGSIFGGALLAAGLAGLVIWSRLVRAKKKFDHASAVEAALEEVDWSVLEASIKKHGPKDVPAT